MNRNNNNKSQKEKTIRLSFTMKERYVAMLSDLAEKDAGSTMSHAVRRLITDEHERIFGKDKQ
jgi:hypothetical protein